ncbi:MAG: AMP-binding protein, partial [Actinomycetia bacterium]|nr:AMP-binding protein [Actinomycetes bacterium]
QPRGETMLYSSGTTGQPKGIKRPLSGLEIDDPAGIPGTAMLLTMLFSVSDESVYLSPAPLYHSAPLGFTAGVQSMGGTTVIMEHFDPALALRYIEQFEITHSQWVPTMFSRMLKLPVEERTGIDFSSHQVAIHAAAPCPVEVKKQMFDLWGPIIFEYYAGTEVNGFVFCTPDDWLSHPGTVGKSILGTIHICDDEGNELPNGESGSIYFELEEMPFEYHNDPEKTRAAQHPEHPAWSTLGDIGYVDDEGYLYLTDRKAFMIISGGINIYPQEIEDCLIMHPKVADVAVFGVPNSDLGEEVKAVVQAESGIEPSDELGRELMAYAQEHIARYKVPRTIDFRPQLPRLPTGKLYKRILRDEYWGNHDSRIV